MCGISGIFQISQTPYLQLPQHLQVMNQLQQHRGPDGEGVWLHPKRFIGFGHRRLKIIDLEQGIQPMTNEQGLTVSFNGEIYNYLELRRELASGYSFQTQSDTEVILAAYAKWGESCVDHFRGMFAFALWDENQQKLFCARDRFGIKPFYYLQQNGCLYFASEAKALLPFLDEITTNIEGLQDYLVFQFCLSGKTLFANISELPPAHTLKLCNGKIELSSYWEVYYDLDFDHTDKYFKEQIEQLLQESIHLHTRSDVPIGAYVSGGIDSSIVATIASKDYQGSFAGFTGKFAEGREFDESYYARLVGGQNQFPVHEITITSEDFLKTIEKIIYHLDFPVAGPGSFPQYHVSKLASNWRKVVLGGQGGDEIFGGYTRYLIAYFEQCIKAAIDGTSKTGNFIVTYESIIPNLVSLKNYKPLLQEFWKEGLFEALDQRYYRLINRAPSLSNEIHWDLLDNTYSPFKQFCSIFHGTNVGKESYFDSMTHFDFKTLLPALLHVEDRMSMAWGIESRVPFVDHKVVEFAATMPSDIKFKNGSLKRILMQAMGGCLPNEVLHRKDKMGFPVPLQSWLQGPLKDFVMDVFQVSKLKNRPLFNHPAIIAGLEKETKFGRKIWGLLSLELWYQQFHDKAASYRALIEKSEIITV